MKKIDLVIIGGGSAGMAAAISAYDEGIRDIVIFDKDDHLGGILFQCIHSGFGLQEFKEQLSGPEYAERFIKEVEKRNIKYYLNTTVLEITRDKVVKYSSAKEGYQEIQAKAIILASGCRERSRGSIDIPGDRPSGVMTAGVAQYYLNIAGYLPGKRVFILGSGDIGLIMARRMTLEGVKVLGVAELMPYSNGLNRNIVQCLNDFDIPLYLSHTVVKIIGKDRLEKIVIAKVDENLKPIEGSEKSFEVDTLLLSVGLIPDTDLLSHINVGMNKRTKGALVNESLETEIPGIFSCGNALHVHDLVDYVTMEGRISGKSAAAYIKGKMQPENEILTTKNLNGVGYIVPARISVPNIQDNVVLKFRVNKPYTNVRISIKVDGKEIRNIFKPFMLPSEMENIAIGKDLLPNQGELTVEVCEK